MELKTVNLKGIKPYARNPRKNSAAVEAVMESIRQCGYCSPIVVDENMVILAGHTRFKAMKELGLKDAQVIIRSGMSEEQKQKFRLLDNKVGELADWDESLLQEELLGLDFEGFDFGFDVGTDLFDDELEKALKHEASKEATQEKRANILNLGYAQFPGEGAFDIPIIEPVTELPEVTEWIGFNYVLSDKHPQGKGVHFFVDDYQFERVWNEPDRYVDLLARYEAVIAPDFSPYADMPLAASLFNHYRKHWLAAYMQSRGITVIPCLRASLDERYYAFCADGEPHGGVVAISAMWTRSEEQKSLFRKEYQFFMDKLAPSKILVYGGKLKNLPGNVEYIPTFAEKRFKK